MLHTLQWGSQAGKEYDHIAQGRGRKGGWERGTGKERDREGEGERWREIDRER